MRTIAKPLAAHGVDAVAIVPQEPGGAAERLRDAGIKVLEMPIHRMRATRRLRPHLDFVGRLPFEVRGLARAFRAHQIDVVVQATLVPPHGALAARRAGLPLVWQIVDTRPPAPVQAAIMPLVRRYADVTMFCGQALAPRYTGSRPMPMPTEIFYPPVDTKLFRVSPERRRSTRERYRIPVDAPVVGMVGNLNPQKGWEYFVRAAGLMYRTHPDMWFMLVGAVNDVHRDYVKLIEEEMSQSGVPRNRFVMTGASNEVESLLPAFDVKLITSAPRSEGAPTSGLEALSCGVPIVGVDVAAISEFVREGITGFVVPPLQPQAIADAASSIVDDDELRARLGVAGRRDATERYDATQNARQHRDVFEQACEHRAAR